MEPIESNPSVSSSHEPGASGQTPIGNAVNIGKVLSGRLQSIGVASLEALKIMGDGEAFLRLLAIYPDSCYHERLALAGAVRDIRWHYLPAEVKEAAKKDCEP